MYRAFCFLMGSSVLEFTPGSTHLLLSLPSVCAHLLWSLPSVCAYLLVCRGPGAGGVLRVSVSQCPKSQCKSVFSTKNADTYEQKSNFSKIFNLLSQNELQATSDEKWLYFRIKHAATSNYRGATFFASGQKQPNTKSLSE